MSPANEGAPSSASGAACAWFQRRRTSWLARSPGTDGRGGARGGPPGSGYPPACADRGPRPRGTLSAAQAAGRGTVVSAAAADRLFGLTFSSNDGRAIGNCGLMPSMMLQRPGAVRKAHRAALETGPSPTGCSGSVAEPRTPARRFVVGLRLNSATRTRSTHSAGWLTTVCRPCMPSTRCGARQGQQATRTHAEGHEIVIADGERRPEGGGDCWRNSVGPLSPLARRCSKDASPAERSGSCLGPTLFRDAVRRGSTPLVDPLRSTRPPASLPAAPAAAFPGGGWGDRGSDGHPKGRPRAFQRKNESSSGGRSFAAARGGWATRGMLGRTRRPGRSWMAGRHVARSATGSTSPGSRPSTAPRFARGLHAVSCSQRRARGGGNPVSSGGPKRPLGSSPGSRCRRRANRDGRGTPVIPDACG